MTTDYDKRHHDLLLPVVQVQTGAGGGSGTVVYSKENDKGEYSTFVLTNHHVIDSMITIKEEWSPLLGRKVKADVRSQPNVNFFEYRWASRAIGATAVKADIVAYDVNEDLALLKLLTERPVPAVAMLYPRGKEHELRATMPLYAVGAGAGEPPLITPGMLSQFGAMIDNREFWVSSTPIYFGNSGGALFLADSHELLGVPSRMRVSMLGMSADAVTHIAFNIPITRVYGFFDSQMFQFLYDDTHTETGDAEARKAIRHHDLLEQASKSAEESLSGS